MPEAPGVGAGDSGTGKGQPNAGGENRGQFGTPLAGVVAGSGDSGTGRGQPKAGGENCGQFGSPVAGWAEAFWHSSRVRGGLLAVAGCSRFVGSAVGTVWPDSTLGTAAGAPRGGSSGSGCSKGFCNAASHLNLGLAGLGVGLGESGTGSGKG